MSMVQNHVVYLHGFGSSGRTSKALHLAEKMTTLDDTSFHSFEFTPTPADFQYMTISGMVGRLRYYLSGCEGERLFLVGSSLGALVCLVCAHRYGGIDGLLLLAPATHFMSSSGDVKMDKVFHYAFDRELPLEEGFYIDGKGYAEPVPPGAPTVIIHGRHDSIIPVSSSHAYYQANREQVTLHEVESDHRLLDQADFIWKTLAQMLQLDPGMA